jgi:hypothetical protein
MSDYTGGTQRKDLPSLLDTMSWLRDIADRIAGAEAEAREARRQRDFFYREKIEAEARVKELEGDVSAAAGELMVPLPEPGTDMARVLVANSLLRAKVSRLIDAGDVLASVSEMDTEEKRIRARVRWEEAKR